VPVDAPAQNVTPFVRPSRPRSAQLRNFSHIGALNLHKPTEEAMSFGKGALLWLIGIPLPIILLLALFWR
jgi:hypothetical protein